MADIITLARQLGHAIQGEDFYKNLQTAKTAADSDETLQNLIGEFNLKRMNINNEACKTDRNEETLRTLNQEMRAVYADIMAHPITCCSASSLSSLRGPRARIPTPPITSRIVPTTALLAADATEASLRDAVNRE